MSRTRSFISGSLTLSWHAHQCRSPCLVRRDMIVPAEAVLQQRELVGVLEDNAGVGGGFSIVLRVRYPR